MRFAIANENLPQQSAPKEKKMALSLNELHAAIPAELAHLIEGCDVDGCEVDLFGIPLCVPCRERGKLVPYAKKALNKINSGSS